MSKKPKFQRPKGMRDLLGEELRYFQRIYEVCEGIANFYRFERIETPIVEETKLFLKGVGTATDIVKKEMYSFKSKGGDDLTLRPEGTAPIVRAYIEEGMQSLPQPIRLWYFGPYFRYEKPQAGRYRQFWQFGFEILGEKSPVTDVQIIQIFYNILRELKFKNLIIEINSIGDSNCRPYYRKLLTSFLRSRESALCANCRRRLRENPLRVLDCKEEKCQRTISSAPQMINHLCDECYSHFREVLEILDEIELPYHLNPYLVRGLDYYTKTVFEIFAKESEREEPLLKKNALVGGGRYDNLVKLLGGKDTPAVGGAAGLERIVLAMKERGIVVKRPAQIQIFLAQIGNLAKRKSLLLLENFRKAKIPVAEALGRDSLKAQLKIADKLGVKYTLILGQKEALEGTIILRDMESGRQEIVKLDKIIKEMKKRLKKLKK